MRFPFILIVLVGALSSTGCQTTSRDSGMKATHVAASPRTVDAGCATCVFDMEGVNGCPLAVRIDGKPYLVTGSDMKDHGNAHGAHGMCNMMRQAQVTGEIEGDHFAAKSFEVLPTEDAGSH